MRRLDFVEKEDLRRDLPPFRVGDTVRVHAKIKEGEKERIQVFEGVVIRRRGGSRAETFTVRKVSNGVGVERIFPVQSPLVTKIEIKSRGFVRRSRLYYLRELSGKKARLHSKVRDLSGLLSEEDLEALEREERGEVVEEPAADAAPAEEAAAETEEAAAEEAPRRPKPTRRATRKKRRSRDQPPAASNAAGRCSIRHAPARPSGAWQATTSKRTRRARPGFARTHAAAARASRACFGASTASHAEPWRWPRRVFTSTNTTVRARSTIASTSTPSMRMLRATMR